MRHIVYNAIRTPDGTVIESKNRHDYVTHLDTVTNREYMVDGGWDYLRRSAFNDAVDLSLYDDDDFELVRQHIKRFNNFTNSYTCLAEMSDQWLDNVIDLVLNHLNSYSIDWYMILLIKEKQYRVENEISIQEDEKILVKANELKEKINSRGQKAAD